MTPSSAVRLFAVLGDPVAHSLSPRMHNAAFTAAGIDAVYVAIRCGAAEFASVLRDVAHAGGGGNVTLPHKETAARLVDDASAAVHATGACNTFWLENRRVRGDNTDVVGLANAALTLVESLAGARALVLGAGGGAAAAVRALLEHSAGRITVLARSPGRAARIAARQDPGGAIVEVVESVARLHGRAFDLVINATPLGLRAGDPLPLEFERIGAVGAIVDMTYRPEGTHWVDRARSLGIPACDGTIMLLEQGAASFRDWFDRDAPLAAMRNALAL